MSASKEERNVVTVKQLYDAFKRRDISTVVNMSTDDVVMYGPTPAAGVLPWGGARRGRDGVAQFFKVLGESLEPHQFELHDFIAQGNKVVVIGYQKGRAVPTGKPYEIEFVHIWTLHSTEEKFSEFRVYNDTAALVEALHQ